MRGPPKQAISGKSLFSAIADYKYFQLLFQYLLFLCFQQSMESRCFTVTRTTPNIRCVKTFSAPLTITDLVP